MYQIASQHEFISKNLPGGGMPPDPTRKLVAEGLLPKR